MKIYCALLFILISMCTQAQITLKVDFQSDKDEQVEIWLYDNFIINSKHLVYSADRNLSTKTEKTVKINHTSKILVKTKHHEKRYYVQPGYTYSITIQANDIILQSEDRTTKLMAEVEKLFTEYAKKGVRLPSGNYKKSYVPLMKALVNRLDTLYTDNEYFNKLLRYYIARVKFIIIRHTTDLNQLEKLEKEYLSNATVDYWNPIYINFISYFYFARWQDSRLHHRESNIEEAPYNTYFNELGFANNDTVKQIAALSFVQQGSRSYWGGPKERTNELLDSLSKNALNPTLKESIVYTYRKVNSLKVGDKVTDFTYYGLDNKEANLSQFRGKWVLLDFWFIGCTSCHEAIPDLKKLQKKYADCLEIVSINPINDTDKVIKYREKYNLGWNFLNAKHDSNIRTYFNIIYYPTYFLIDPQGNFNLVPNQSDLSKIKDDIQLALNTGCK